MENPNIIKLNSWDANEFVSELDEISKDCFEFYFDDVLVNNIEEFFKSTLNCSLIVLHKFDEIDLILIRKLNKFFTKFHKEFLEKNIKFYGFSQEEICSIISEDLYFSYCNKYNIKFCKTLKIMKSETEKLEKYSEKLFKYAEFNIIYNFFKQNDRYMYFNFPNEIGLDRFVFYFLINTKNDKDEIIKLFKKVNLNKKCLEILSNMSICENGSLYAVGFNYKDSKLERSTLYSRLNIFSKKIENCKFLKKHFNLDSNQEDELGVKDWGVDLFDDGPEVLKVYFDEVNFNCKNYNELTEVLKNKSTVSCFKYKKDNLGENVLINKKYEFSNNLFNESEIKVLEKFNIYDKKSKLFSVYLDENDNLKNSVNYII
jgi:hypothetical protein